MKSLLFATLTFFASTQIAWAEPNPFSFSKIKKHCVALFSKATSAPPAITTPEFAKDIFVSEDSAFNAPEIKEFLRMEQTSNQKRWGKPTHVIPIEFIALNKDQVEVRKDPVIEPEFIKFFENETAAFWYRHPLNQSDVVPHRTAPASGSIAGFYSASRSMFVSIMGGFYSLKLGTDHPHPNSSAQVEKADLLNDSDISMRRSKHIRRVDSEEGHFENFYILTEVLSIRSGNNGFSVRDLTPLQNGNHYIPGFSIPYRGKEIAQELGVDFDQLWGEHYAKALGKAKAQLLIRYGLQMKTPNAQNWIVELDPAFHPTGRIFMRDVADSNYVQFVAEHNGAKEEMDEDSKSNYKIMKELNPYWENSAWQMDEGGVRFGTINKWGVQHDEAYIEAVVEMLDLRRSFASITALEEFLKSDDGKLALERYRDFRKHRLPSRSADFVVPDFVRTAA